MCLSNGSSEFGNPTPLFFVIAVKCCLRAILRSPFKLKTLSSLAKRRAYCHFYYFSTLKIFNSRAAHFTDALSEQKRIESAHFFLLT
jgi:hypothetical protein